MRRKNQVQTPKWLVDFILDRVELTGQIYKKTILENSCGEGNFLTELVERYIKSCKENKKDAAAIKKYIEKNIVAYEIDRGCIDKCKKRLDDVAKKYGLNDVSWNIKNEDYLKNTSKKEYDLIVGNPPYITYHDILIKDRDYLRETFKTCRNGRFDYYYAFIEKSISMLKKDGRMWYLIPFNFFKNESAYELREMLRDGLITVIDYSGMDLFNGISITSTLIEYEKEIHTIYMDYFNVKKKLNKKIYKKELSSKWCFGDKNNGKQRFGDLFEVKNSVATLCNEAYLLRVANEDDDYVYTEIGEQLERKVVFDAISIKTLRDGINKKIIFPYLFDENSNIKRISEDTFKDKYPYANQYLKKFFLKLNNRNANRNASWFEYGRSQALNDMKNKKLIMSMIITNEVRVFKVEPFSIPYAGCFIQSRNGAKLDTAMEILKSRRFYQYVIEHGTPTTKRSYRISVSDVEDYLF